MMDKAMMTQAQAAFSAGAGKPPTVHGNMDMDAIRDTARDFEAFYLSQALQPMFANLTPSGPFSGGPGEEMWRSMQVEEYGKALAKAGGVGLADAVVREMIRMQEMGENPTP